jgi:hypothetical protein
MGQHLLTYEKRNACTRGLLHSEGARLKLNQVGGVLLRIEHRNYDNQWSKSSRSVSDHRPKGATYQKAWVASE